MDIPEKSFRFIHHCNRNLFGLTKEIWIKKGTESNYDVPMVLFDWAKICEIVGRLRFHNINTIIDHGYHIGKVLLFWTAVLTERGTKYVRKTTRLNRFGFGLDIQINLKVDDILYNALYNTLNLTVSPFKKLKHKPCNIDTESNRMCLNKSPWPCRLGLQNIQTAYL